MTWTDAPNSLDGGTANGGCWADDLDEFVGVGSDGGLTEAIIKSADGISWIYQASPFDGGAGRAAVRDLFHSLYVAVGLGPGSTDAILTSPDGVGGNWTGRGNPFVGYGTAVATAVRDSDGALLAAGGNNSDDQLGISLDNGATWTKYAPLNSGDQVLCVTVRQSDDLLVVGGFGSSVSASVSSDGGSTWTKTAPFGASGEVHACAIRVSDGAIVVVGIDDSSSPLVWKVAISTDSGSTWTVVTDPFAAATGVGVGLAGVAVRSDDAIIVAGCNAITSGTEQVAISTNGGTTWTPSSPFGTNGAANCIALRPSDEALVVGGLNSDTNETVAISTNSGVTWVSHNLTAQNLDVCYAVALRPSDDAIFAYGVELVTSTDGGATWTDLGAPLPTAATQNGISVRTADDAIVIAGNGLPSVPHAGVSTDGGTIFLKTAPLSDPGGPAVCVACKQSTGRLIAGAESAVAVLAYSNDAIGWTSVDGTPFDNDAVAGIDYSPGENRWMAGGGSGVVAAVSIDDGVTWVSLTHPMTLIAGVYRDEANGRWWLLGQTTGGFSAAYSTDGGATWTEKSTPLDPAGQATAMVNCGGPLALAGVDAAGTAQMCVSTDAGNSWQLDASPSPFGVGAAKGLAYSSFLPLAVVFGSGA